MLCIIIGTAFPAFAQDDIQTEIITEDECVSEESDTVVTMYLCATANSLCGHVWLYFVNETDRDLPLGYVTLEAGDSMSIGSLKNTRSDGGGTYYNGEAFMAKDLEKVCKHTTSLKKELTLDELETVNKKIKSLNFYSVIFWNCGSFATTVWNTVQGDKIVHVVLPVFTILGMKLHGAEKGKVLMERPDENEGTGFKIYKQTKNGAKQANEKSLRTSCVG